MGPASRVPASFFRGIKASMCVLKMCVVCVCACVCVSLKGWDRPRREQRLLVPEVRSACRRDALPFSRTPAADTQEPTNTQTHTHTHTHIAASKHTPMPSSKPSLEPAVESAVNLFSRQLDDVAWRCKSKLSFSILPDN